MIVMRKYFLIFSFFVIFLFSHFVSVGFAVAKPDPICVLMFHDGYKEHESLLCDNLTSLNVRGTFAVVVNRTDWSARCNWTQIERLAVNHQVCSHSWDHKNETECSVVELEEELNQTRWLLYEHLGVFTDWHIYPFWSTNGTVIEYLRLYGYDYAWTYYSSSPDGFVFGWDSRKDSYRLPSTAPWGSGAYGQMKGYVDSLVSAGSGYVMGMGLHNVLDNHSLTESEYESKGYVTQLDNLTAIISYGKANGVRFLACDELEDYFAHFRSVSYGGSSGSGSSGGFMNNGFFAGLLSVAVIGVICSLLRWR